MPEALAGDRTIDVDFVGALAGCRLHSKQRQYGAGASAGTGTGTNVRRPNEVRNSYC